MSAEALRLFEQISVDLKTLALEASLTDAEGAKVARLFEDLNRLRGAYVDVRLKQQEQEEQILHDLIRATFND